MKFTDLFIRRPVLATVISLLILVLGLRSLGTLKRAAFPEMQNAVVTVSTVYTGADPALVSGFISTPIEHAVAQANGIDYLTSSAHACEHDSGLPAAELRFRQSAYRNQHQGQFRY